jgi:hypothetical protein
MATKVDSEDINKKKMLVWCELDVRRSEIPYHETCV